jgi:lipopolysaccharide transport system permease protein
MGNSAAGAVVQPDCVATAADVPVTVIGPRRGWQAIDFGELWRYRELLYFLVWRDVKVRYKQTVLGAAWAILQPALTMVIFSVIFGKFARIPSNGLPYPIFVYAGLLAWTFFANAVSQSGMSLVSQSQLLTKIYFPRLLVPSASVGAGLVDLALSFSVYVVLMLWYGYAPGPLILLLPLLVGLTAMTALGTGYILASLAVTYRDFRFIVPFMMQVWMFLSPVIYPVTLLPQQYRWLMALNPMAGIVAAFRSVLLNEPLDPLSLGSAALIGTGLFVFGLYNFRRMERRFADIA